MDRPAAPASLFRGYTMHVNHVNSVEISLSLPFGVSITKIILLDGIDSKKINGGGHRQNALRCLVTMLGRGRKVYVKCEDRLDGVIPGIVYIDDFSNHGQEGVTQIETIAHPVLNVNAFYSSLAASGYDVSKAREPFKGQA